MCFFPSSSIIHNNTHNSLLSLSSNLELNEKFSFSFLFCLRARREYNIYWSTKVGYERPFKLVRKQNWNENNNWIWFSDAPLSLSLLLILILIRVIFLILLISSFSRVFQLLARIKKIVKKWRNGKEVEHAILMSTKDTKRRINMTYLSFCSFFVEEKSTLALISSLFLLLLKLLLAFIITNKKHSTWWRKFHLINFFSLSTRGEMRWDVVFCCFCSSRESW